MSNEEEERRERIRRLIESEAETRAEPPVEQKPNESADSTAATRAHPPQRTPTPPPHISLDKDNMPLPRRVDEVDMEGTRVTPVAYEPTSRPRNGAPVTYQPPPPPPLNPPMQTAYQPSARPVANPWRLDMGCLARLLVIILFGAVILLLIGGTG